MAEERKRSEMEKHLDMLAAHLDYDEVAIQAIKDLRREASQYQEQLHAQKKTLGRDGAELGKWIKEEIKQYMRYEKSATLWIDWFERDVDLSFKDWPEEYYPELMYIHRTYWLKLTEKSYVKNS
jgi:hypothetical protein